MEIQRFHSLHSTHPALMLYFYNDSCGVCTVLWPQVEQLVWEEFPEIQLVRVNAAESRELAGQLRMLSVPGMLLFLEGEGVFPYQWYGAPGQAGGANCAASDMYIKALGMA